jgi:hypothetical protein
MCSKRSKLVALVVGVALFQITWHWFITTQTTVAQALLRLYLQHNPHSRKGVAGYVDLALPAVVLGIVIGRTGWQWPVRKLVLYGLVVGVVLAALDFVYAVIVGLQTVWWWPKTSTDLILYAIGNTTMTIFLTLVCVYGGRAWAVGLHENPDQ